MAQFAPHGGSIPDRRRHPQPTPVTSAWHAAFLKMLPAITRHAKIAFRHLRAEAREEAVQGTICNACAAIARLAELGKLDMAYATVLARYGVAQVKDGRTTGGHLNCKDISSPYCRRLKGIVMERLDQYNVEEDTWKEIAIGNRTADAARKFGVCEGRVSQLRNELAESWRQFVGDEPTPEAA